MKKCIIFSFMTILCLPVHSQEATTAVNRVASCEINPTQNSRVSGTVTFTETASGIMIVADLTGLPKGSHGFHIHEKGDCTAPDGSSAGGHFNPSQHQHGNRDSEMRHTGDMGNIEADSSGKAHLEYLDKMMTFDGENSIIGRSVIVHEKADDYKTQPTGNSGARIGCGIIRLL
ncbi:MAG: superoxide dismutase family protein [Syntrophothermus sp.]